MPEVKQIGRCIGCVKSAQLCDGVCKECLESPRRGRRWAQMANRIRNDPEFARVVYSQIKTVNSRKIFMFMFRDIIADSGVDMSFMDALAEINTASK